jgi:hypothetical protein
MNGKVLAAVLMSTVLADCSRASDHREELVKAALAECNHLLPSLEKSPLLAPFAAGRIDNGATCTANFSRSHAFSVASLKYDFTKIDAAHLQRLGLTKPMALASGRLRHGGRAIAVQCAPQTKDLVLFVVQKYPNQPSFFAALHDPGVDVTATQGNITITKHGLVVDMETRIAIVDSPSAASDSSSFNWDAHAENSVGAVLCPDPNNCPSVTPPAWPNDFANNHRSIITSTGPLTFLSFTIPSIGSNTYEYALRAFGRGLQYDIDPWISNRP